MEGGRLMSVGDVNNMGDAISAARRPISFAMPAAMLPEGGTAAVSGPGSLEVITPDLDAAIHWTEHGYPHPLAKWHHHPQVEFHLIREGSGLMMAGDGVLPFEEGHVALIGANLPHNWVSDLRPGERLEHRDVVCHVRPEVLRVLMTYFPECSGFGVALHRASYALVLSGRSAARAASCLETMGGHEGVRRLADFVELLAAFEEAPEGEWSTVVTPGYDPSGGSGSERLLNAAIGYVTDNLGGDIRLEEAAAQAAMSSSAFSRFFKRTAGVGFADFVRRLRIGRACRLLATTDMPVARIQRECGYDNASNFNRRFLAETGVTPSAYRKARQGY